MGLDLGHDVLRGFDGHGYPAKVRNLNLLLELLYYPGTGIFCDNNVRLVPVERLGLTKACSSGESSNLLPVPEAEVSARS